jgi:hypothetical protein
VYTGFQILHQQLPDPRNIDTFDLHPRKNQSPKQDLRVHSSSNNFLLSNFLPTSTSKMAANSVTSPQPRRSPKLSAAPAFQPSTIASTSNHTSSNTTNISPFGSARSKPLKKFAFFPKLPTELRVIIWELSLPKPRVVEISISDDEDSLVAKTDSPLPAHFKANFEARQVAFKNYPLVFSSILSSPMRFSFERDILYFDAEVLFKIFCKEMPDKANEKLCHLMLARDEDFIYKPETVQFVQEFSNLKSIILESADTALRPTWRRLVTMNEKLCYNRQLQAFRKAQTLFSTMGELMGNMLWKRDMNAVAQEYESQGKPIFEKLRKVANASKLRSLDCK